MKWTFAAFALFATPVVAADDPRVKRIEAVARANGFDGQILIASGDRVLFDRGVGSMIVPKRDEAMLDGSFPRDIKFNWPWASVTKQVVAVLVMREVDRGRVSLDAPARRYLPALGRSGGPTVRQLLQHRSGLRNPEDSPKGKGGQPSFYAGAGAPLTWCLAGRKPAGSAWRYNNCDYHVLGELLRRVTGKAVPELWAELARPLGISARFAGPDDTLLYQWVFGPSPGERAILARFGPAGGLGGLATDLLTFDRALLSGRLLSAKSRAELWRGDPALGHMALGQWSFEAPVKGCAKSVRVVERRGGIGRFQVRNILVPDKGLMLIAFTHRADAQFGEIWQGRGLSHDLLAAAACT